MLHCKAISVETLLEGLTSDATLTSVQTTSVHRDFSPQKKERLLYPRPLHKVSIQHNPKYHYRTKHMQHRLALYLPRHHRLTEPLLLVEKKVSPSSVGCKGRSHALQLPQRGPPAEAEQAPEEETSKPTMSASMFTSSHPT